VPQSPLFFTERSRIAALAIAIHLPTLYGFREHSGEILAPRELGMAMPV
jgi:hypothetical protein